MPRAGDLSGPAGWALALGVSLVAALLAWRQWREGSGREPDLSDEDVVHFARQDVRRYTGAASMALIALAIAIGSSIDPLGGGGIHRIFVAIWAGVIALILILIGLAGADWLATLAYARRHRRAIVEERRALFEAERRRRRASAGERPDPGPGPLGNGPLPRS